MNLPVGDDGACAELKVAVCLLTLICGTAAAPPPSKQQQSAKAAAYIKSSSRLENPVLNTNTYACIDVK
jgi:hypothetical protein